MDTEDLKRVMDGHIDLQQCDLRESDLSNMDLRGRNFEGALLDKVNFSDSDLSGSSFLSADTTHSSFRGANCEGCKFDRVLYNVNFLGANLRRAKISSLMTKCNFENADLREADFRGGRFGDDNALTNVLYNESTNFEGVTALRKLSRLPVFEFFSYDRGRFNRRKEIASSHETDESFVQGSEINLVAIENRLKIDRNNSCFMAASLASAVDDFLLKLAVPNEPQKLEFHESYVGIMKEVSAGLKSISESLSREPSSLSSDEDVKEAALVVRDLKNKLFNWIGESGDKIIALGANTGLLGAGCAFLTYCGAPGWQAFPVMAFLVGGKALVETFKTMKSE